MNDRSLTDFSHALSQNRIDNLSLAFELKEDVAILSTQTIAIWCNVWNVFRIMVGMGGAAYNWYSSRRHLELTPPAATTTPAPTSAPAPAEPTERVNRPITDPEYVCPITLEPIASGGEYHMCHQCNHAFSRAQFS
jgi:hypothetical protein